MSDPILSVIVPVYNVEDYLDECLGSLASQTLKEMEILVVNDGTKDHSQDIIDRYAERYPTLFLPLKKENGGLSSARNFALPLAKGKYLAFLDSDDYVEKDYYEKIVSFAEEHGPALVVADLEYFWEDGSKAPMRQPGLNRVNDSVQKSLFLSPLFSWNKLYRRDLFEELQLRYPEGLWYEDIPVTLAYFAACKSPGHCPVLGVHYRQRSSSIMGSSYNEKMNDIFTVFERVTASFKEKGLYAPFRQELEYLYIEHFLVYGAFRFLRTDHYRELMEKAFAFVRKEFPDYRKNPYISTFNRKNQLFLQTNNSLTKGFWHWYLTK